VKGTSTSVAPNALLNWMWGKGGWPSGLEPWPGKNRQERPPKENRQAQPAREVRRSPKVSEPKVAEPEENRARSLPISGDLARPHHRQSLRRLGRGGPGKAYYFPPGLQDGKDKRMTLLVQPQGHQRRAGSSNGSFFIKDREAARGNGGPRSSSRFPRRPDAGAGGTSRPAWVVAFATQNISTTIAKDPDLKPYVVSVVLGRPLASQSLPIPNSLPLVRGRGLSAKAAKLAAFGPPAAPARRCSWA